MALAVRLAQFAPAAVANVAGEAVAALAAVELDEDAPPEVLVAAVVEEVNRLWGSADVLERPGEPREMARLAAQRTNELAGGGVSLQQAPAILSFMVPTRSRVREVHALECRRGDEILDPARHFPQYPQPYFATFWLDPHGFKLEAVCHHDAP